VLGATLDKTKDKWLLLGSGVMEPGLGSVPGSRL
jgi:hypothetical protein